MIFAAVRVEENVRICSLDNLGVYQLLAREVVQRYQQCCYEYLIHRWLERARYRRLVSFRQIYDD